MEAATRAVDRFLETLKAARSVSTPLIAIRTTDPALSAARVREIVGSNAAVLQWDIVRGLYHLGKPGEQELRRILGEREAGGVGPADALILAEKLGEDGVLIFSNAQRFWNDPTVAQGIWNLRDSFKAEGRTLVLFTTPGAIPPDELTQDVLILDEPLPAIEDLSQISKKRLRRRASRTSVQTRMRKPLMRCWVWRRFRPSRSWRCRWRRRGSISISFGSASGRSSSSVGA